jgi:hypothetical protein
MSLCSTKYHITKTYWGVELWLHALLTSALDGGEWSASRPGGFTPGVRSPLSIAWEAEWVLEPVWTLWRRE